MRYKVPFALWTRDAVSKLEVPIRTAGEYLSRRGFTPQKLTERAYEQDPEKLSAWLDNEHPEVLTRAKRETAEIHRGDETGINSEG